MSNDNKTLADVQPGGRVRLGNQAERARFEAWLATQHDQGSEHVMATVSATDDRYQSPVTSSMWSAWQAANSAREGGRINGWKVVDGVRVYSAYAHASILDDQQYVRYEDYLAALSAQPSPGGQRGVWMLPDDARIVGVIADSIERGKLDHPGFYRNTQLGEVLRRVLSAALAARQPVGEPVGYATFRDGRFGSWLFQTHAMAESHDSTAVAGGPANSEIVPLFRSPAQGVDLAQEPMFYIQDTRQFVGNCPVWWGPNGSGYVTRLDEAGRYTEQEAVKQNRCRETDIPWPCAEIEAIARRTVDFQHMRPRAERLAELALIDSQAVGK